MLNIHAALKHAWCVNRQMELSVVVVKANVTVVNVSITQSYTSVTVESSVTQTFCYKLSDNYFLMNCLIITPHTVALTGRNPIVFSKQHDNVQVSGLLTKMGQRLVQTCNLTVC